MIFSCQFSKVTNYFKLFLQALTNIRENAAFAVWGFFGKAINGSKNINTQIGDLANL